MPPLPWTSALQEQSIDIRFELRSALLAIGEHERILDHLREAQTCAESLKDQQRIARTLVYQTTYLWNAGDPHGAATSGNRALVIAQELKDDALGIVGGIGVAWAYHALGEYGQAINSLRTTIAALSGERLTQSFGLAGLPAVVARTWLAWCLAIRGEFAESLAVAQEGLNIAQTADHPYSLVIGCFGVGVSHLARGEQILRDAKPAMNR